MMEENVSYIPSRLKSAVKGGYVTGAGDIVDDELGLTQAEINDIVLGGSISTSLSVTGAVFIGSGASVRCIAEFGVAADRISLYRGSYSEEPVGVNPVSSIEDAKKLDYTDTITAVGGNNPYTAFFTKGNLVKHETKSAVGVLPIYYGALASYSSSSLTMLSTATTTAKGTYTMGLDTTPRKIYFKVPKQNVTGVTKVELLSEGNYSPVLGSISSELSDADYNVWVSDDAYNVDSAGNRSFVVNR